MDPITVHATDDFDVVIVVNEKGNPPDKLADAELHFTSGSLAGLKFVGLGVWQRRESANELNVTMPARTFMAGGEKRSFSLIRVAHDLGTTEDKREYYQPLNALQAIVISAYQTAISGTVEPVPDDDNVPF